MAAEGMVQSGKSSPVIRQLEGALTRIGVTGAHKQIIALVLIGCLFDSFEQNTIGVSGPLLKEHWGLTGTDIGFLNTITFGSAAIGRLLSGILGDRYGRRVMLTINLLLFSLGSAACALAPRLRARVGMELARGPSSRARSGVAHRPLPLDATTSWRRCASTCRRR